MTHTPGPWHTSNITEIWGGPHCNHIASTVNRRQDDPGLVAGEIADNARLIAAAPALLEALEAAEIQVRAACRRAGDDTDTIHTETEQIRAAIALAKGESK